MSTDARQTTRGIEWGRRLSATLAFLIMALIGIAVWASSYGTLESSRFIWLAIAAGR